MYSNTESTKPPFQKPSHIASIGMLSSPCDNRFGRASFLRNLKQKIFPTLVRSQGTPGLRSQEMPVHNVLFDTLKTKSDNTFATANFLGTVRPGILPVKLKYKGKLNRNDRVDVFRLDVASGTSFSGASSTTWVKGGSLQAEIYVALPGQNPVLADFEIYPPGVSREQYDELVTVPPDQTFQMYLVVRSLNSKQPIAYKSKEFFY